MKLAFPATLLVFLSFLACRPKATPPIAEAAPPHSLGAPTSSSPTPPAPVTPLTPNARTEDERNTVAVFRELAPSTVFVTQKQRVRTDIFSMDVEEVTAGSGSGFIWDNQGHIVTN